MSQSFPNPLRASAGSRRRLATRGLAVAILATGATALLTVGQPASAGIVPPVPLATAAEYSVLAGTTVTNTGPSVLGQSAGLHPGTAIDGFPPGIVLGTEQAANAVALQAQSDLTIAYDNAAGRSVEFTESNDLVGKTLIPGVYAATAKAPLSLTGRLVLDGQGNADAVFIFQTDSTLITSSGSSILLVNGASACNVFWQVQSSATIGTGSTFVGNILALTSISVQTGATVQGRALARNGAVTLDNNVFTQPSCSPSTDTVPPTTIDASATTSVVEVTTTSSVGDVTVPSDVASTLDTTASTPAFVVTDITLPRTGKPVAASSAIAAGALLFGAGALLIARRRKPA